jgi:hypothetical protein
MPAAARAAAGGGGGGGDGTLRWHCVGSFVNACTFSVMQVRKQLQRNHSYMFARRNV